MSVAIPIFVMGVPHSGTTILYRMLAMHPDVAWFSQFAGLDGSIPGQRRIPGIGMLEWLLRRQRYNWMKVQVPWRRYVVPLPEEGWRIFEYVLPAKMKISTDESANRMRRFFEAECRRWGKGTIVVKLPRLFRQVPAIRHAYPTAPFVHIIRDGRAVALSLRPFLEREGASSMQALESSARLWLEGLAALRPESEAGRSLDIGYEDFCTDVRGWVRRAVEFTGLDPGRFPYDRIPASLAPTNDRWLKTATRDEMELLERVLGEPLAQLLQLLSKSQRIEFLPGGPGHPPKDHREA